MNRDSIDDIFKSGLQGRTFSNQEAVWQQLEKDLDKGRRKRPLAWFISILLIAGAGSAYLLYPFAGKQVIESQPITAATAPAAAQTGLKTTTEANAAEGAGVNSTKNTTTTIAVAASTTTNVGSGNSIKTHGKSNSKTAVGAADIVTSSAVVNGQKLTTRARTRRLVSNSYMVTTAGEADEVNPVLDTKLIMEANRKSSGVFAPLPLGLAAGLSMRIPAKTSCTFRQAVAPARVASPAQNRKINIELLAGSDVLHLDKQVGYYAGVRIVRNLDKGSAISFGVNYSLNVVSEKYRLSDKPFQQQETDAQLNSMKMLRFPIMFQRQLAKSKFTLMAGLTPSYLLSASVYNVPATITPGNPVEYREFTINDMHRFNVLFGAGLKYAPFNRIAFELSGSYGFTELVKDSYINQSNVNDNFKNIQAGVVFKLR